MRSTGASSTRSPAPNGSRGSRLRRRDAGVPAAHHGSRPTGSQHGTLRVRAQERCHPPRKRHGPGPPAQPSAHPLPAASSPGKSRGPPGGHMRMHARRGGKRQARARPGTGTGTPSSGYPHRSLAPIPVRHASVDTATQRPTTTQDDTCRDRDETPRQHDNSQLAGRFRSVWQVMGSNHRRLSRRFYRPFIPAHRYGR